MFAQAKTINNVKQLVPLTADTGSGNPIGTILPLYKKSTPNGYLYCDGSTFDTTAYPGLYAYLGTNVLPDYREFALVGAEENTTDVYNATTNPNGTIHDHDVYSQGEAKDDQLQDHAHQIYAQAAGGSNTVITLGSTGLGGDFIKYSGNTPITAQGGTTPRTGTNTRGKRKAVYFYIKATTGLDENQQDYVLDTLNDTLRQQRSYSTDEHLTGKYWIDGKDIWSVVITGITVATNWTQITSDISVETLISIDNVLANGQISSTFERKVDNHNVYVAKPSTVAVEGTTFILEYTKTTG